MKFAIIILHFGGIDVTRKCIESLEKNEAHPFSLIVVNNMPQVYKPTDFSSKKVIVINNKKNLGFAKGVNIGIKEALQQKRDAVCLLNNDTLIEKSFLEKLLKNFSKDSVGIVGPSIMFYKKNKKFFDLGGKVNTFFWKTSHKEATNISSSLPRRVDYVSGCCMLIKKEILQKVGFFDEQFFLYYEDADFCLRAKAKGFLTLLDPSVVIFHELSKSAGKMSLTAIYYLLCSGILFGRKYAKSMIEKIANKFFILLQATLFFKANPKAALVIAKAMLRTLQ